MLSVSQTALSFENGGGNQSVTLTANKVWTASSNQGWLRISPSSGDGNASLSVSCEANLTYDTRTGMITITSEELTQTISVTQAEKHFHIRVPVHSVEIAVMSRNKLNVALKQSLTLQTTLKLFLLKYRLMFNTLLILMLLAGIG